MEKVKHNVRVTSSDLRVASSNLRVNSHCSARIERKSHTKVLKNRFHNMALKIIYVTTILPTYFSIGHEIAAINASKDIWSGNLVEYAELNGDVLFICFRLQTMKILVQSLAQKMKIVNFSWNLIHSLTQIWSTQRWADVDSFYFLTILLFMANLFQKIKIVCWSRNLERRLIWICKIRWWCLFILL